MGAGGRSSDPSEGENPVVIGRAPTAAAPFTLGELKKAIPPHCFKRSFVRSFSYLFRDLLAIAVFGCVAVTYIKVLPYHLRYVAWPVYWFLQGSVMTGLWLIGHETGHHAFCDSEKLGDAVGFVLHSCLFTPYYSWKISHRRHHLNGASLEHDELHVPNLKSQLPGWSKRLNNPMGRAFILVIKLATGFHLYMLVNLSGRHYDKFASHYDPRSPIFSDKERILILISDISILLFTYGLYSGAMSYGVSWVFFLYGGPLMVMNGFVVIITYLQHTHPSLPHYDSSEWSWIRGSLSTVDRDYGIFNEVFHHISDTHVVHHLFSTMPHYHAVEATKAIRPILGDYYQFDGTPFLKAFWRESNKCIFVEPDEEKKRGIYWYENKL